MAVDDEICEKEPPLTTGQVALDAPPTALDGQRPADLNARGV